MRPQVRILARRPPARVAAARFPREGERLAPAYPPVEDPIPLHVAEKQLSDPTQRIHKVLETARILYGLIHARYVLTAQGLTDMVRRPILNSDTVRGPKATENSANGAPPRAAPLGRRCRLGSPGGRPPGLPP